MTDHERYKRAASVIQPSAEFQIEDLTEAITMKKTRSFKRAAVTVCVVLAVLVGAMTVSYAADIGGFRQTVRIWLRGEQVEADVERTGDGEYTVTYPDGTEMKTGGIVHDAGGVREMTGDEVADATSNEPDVQEDSDGRIWFFCRDNRVDITDQIADSGYAHAEISDGQRTRYFTISPNGVGGYSISGSFSGYPAVK